MQTRIVLAVLASVSMMVNVPGTAQEGICSPAPRLPSIFPDTIANIELGMSQAELLRVRPAISANAFGGDNVGHAKTMFEKVQAEFIEQVIYLFDEAKPILVGVVYLKRQPAQSATRILPAFRSAVLEKWGVPGSIRYGRAESGAREIALVWRHNDAVMVASYPAGDQAEASAVTSIRIGRRNSVVDIYVDQLERMEKGVQEKLMREMSKQLRDAPTGVTRQ
jgi:hypothetical protein